MGMSALRPRQSVQAMSGKAGRATCPVPVANGATGAHVQYPPLQRSLGNQTIQRLLHSDVAQAKLRISQMNDTYEREADRVADQVMRMAASEGGTPQGSCAACDFGNAPCPACAAEKRSLVQRKPETPSESGNISAPENALQALGSGQPLDPATREYME
jgi:hypothetical protein